MSFYRDRNTGATTKQLREALQHEGVVYYIVHTARMVSYCRSIVAQVLKADPTRIKWVVRGNVEHRIHGRGPGAVFIDHACNLSNHELVLVIEFREASTRAMSPHTRKEVR